MEISISAVTANRNFTKALVRHAGALARLKEVVLGVDTSDLSFDVLQLVFLDRAAGYARAVGCSGDRLFQVEVSSPSEGSVDFRDEAAFVGTIANRLDLAVRLSKLPEQIERRVAQSIRDHLK